MVQFSRAFVAPVAALMLLSATQAAEFMPLGDLPGGEFNSNSSGVSADGSVVVGSGTVVGDGANDNEAFRWTGATGMVAMESNAME